MEIIVIIGRIYMCLDFLGMMVGYLVLDVLFYLVEGLVEVKDYIISDRGGKL